MWLSVLRYLKDGAPYLCNKASFHEFLSSKIGCNLSAGVTYTPFTRTKIIQIQDLDSYLDCYLDRDPEVVPVYTGHSFFITTKRITLFFILQTMLNRSLDNIRINYYDSRSRCSVYTGQNLSI